MHFVVTRLWEFVKDLSSQISKPASYFFFHLFFFLIFILFLFFFSSVFLNTFVSPILFLFLLFFLSTFCFLILSFKLFFLQLFCGTPNGMLCTTIIKNVKVIVLRHWNKMGLELTWNFYREIPLMLLIYTLVLIFYQWHEMNILTFLSAKDKTVSVNLVWH